MALVWWPKTCATTIMQSTHEAVTAVSETTSGRRLSDVLAEQQRDEEAGQRQQRDEGDR